MFSAFIGTVPTSSQTYIWASACDFQQFDISTRVDSDEPVQPPFKLINSKWRSVSSLTIIEYSSDKQRLWSDCAYAQAGLRLCWSHKTHCWKSHALAHIILFKNNDAMYTTAIEKLLVICLVFWIEWHRTIITFSDDRQTWINIELIEFSGRTLLNYHIYP